MNWPRVLMAGVAGGIVLNLANFVMHGIIMGNTYSRYPEVFTQEPANPLWFFLVAICTGIPAAILFARTRSAWGAGFQGGIVFGFSLGLVAFFPPFYNALVMEGFPYYLSWCWGGINLIGFVFFGGTAGAIYGSAPAPMASPTGDDSFS